MSTNKWKTITVRIAVALLLLMPAGCLTAGSGRQHPFATMFQDHDSASVPRSLIQTTCTMPIGQPVATEHL